MEVQHASTHWDSLPEKIILECLEKPVPVETGQRGNIREQDEEETPIETGPETIPKEVDEVIATHGGRGKIISIQLPVGAIAGTFVVRCYLQSSKTRST